MNFKCNFLGDLKFVYETSCCGYDECIYALAKHLYCLGAHTIWKLFIFARETPYITFARLN